MRHPCATANPPTSKELMGYRPPIFLEHCLFNCCNAMLLMNNANHHSPREKQIERERERAVVADGLAPIWNQDICAHRGGVGLPGLLRSIWSNVMLDWNLIKNGRHFAEDMFKCIFLIKNVWLFIESPLVPGIYLTTVQHWFKWRPSTELATCHYVKPRWHSPLTHWGLVTHICVGKITMIVSDNGLSPERRQAIIWTNPGILLIGPSGTKFSEIIIKNHIFSLKKCIWKCLMESGGHFFSASMCQHMHPLQGLTDLMHADMAMGQSLPEINIRCVIMQMSSMIRIMPSIQVSRKKKNVQYNRAVDIDTVSVQWALWHGNTW